MDWKKVVGIITEEINKTQCYSPVYLVQCIKVADEKLYNELLEMTESNSEDPCPERFLYKHVIHIAQKYRILSYIKSEINKTGFTEFNDELKKEFQETF